VAGALLLGRLAIRPASLVVAVTITVVVVLAL
jgi:hypothetical protein